jgi:drug/metabolite transporter (DMT)-like permease
MAIAVVVVWGLTYISTKVLIQQGLHPHEIFFYRFLVAYAGIWLIAPRRLLANSWKEEGLLALAGFFGGSLYFYTENTALGLTQASNVAFLLCTAPLLTAFLSAAFYKEDRLTRRLLMGSMLALCGVGLIVFFIKCRREKGRKQRGRTQQKRHVRSLRQSQSRILRIKIKRAAKETGQSQQAFFLPTVCQ